MDDDLLQIEEAAEAEQEPASIERRVVRSMPISEVREEMLICQWHTHYQEVDRAKVAGAAHAQPGDSVDVFEDGSMVLAPARVVSREKTRVISAPADTLEA